MRIFSKSTLREYWEQNPRAETASRRWHSYVENANGTRRPMLGDHVEPPTYVGGHGKAERIVEGNHSPS